METLLRRNRYEEQVSNVIDRVLRQVFGEEATRLIYRHLERNYSLKREEIGQKIELFAHGLEDFLRSGAIVIERKILEDICQSSGLIKRWELEDVADERGFVSQMKSLLQSA
jgi:ERCC4-type nuclease